MKFLFLVAFFSLSSICFAQRRFMVFANGYISPFQDKIPRNNGVTQIPQGYWYAFDDTIRRRFNPVIPFYISGHHPVSTSVHRSKLRFIGSWMLSRCIWFRSEQGFSLNKTYNPDGFMTRYANGEICGNNFLQFVQDSLDSFSRKDTLDLVCHSMGYAYILGFLHAVDTTFTLGKALILSPESPGFMGYEWHRFQEVWQYGSDLGMVHSDIICFQDGIAPQGPVKGIESLAPSKGGRIFLPKDAKKGFIRSHHMKWYDWVYGIKPGEYGYFGR